MRIFLLFCLLMVSCAPGPRVAPVSDTLMLNIGAEPSVLNPILYTDGPSGKVIELVFNGLLRVNEQLEMEPDLCKHYEVLDHGRRYIFELRDDVVWHDGTPFTAADVKFTFDTILDKKTNTVRRSNYLIDGKPIRWRVLGKHKIEARLPKAYGPFLVRAAMEILPKHLLDGQDINVAEFNRKPVGTGPFKFVEWKSGQYVKLTRFESYHAGAPKLKNVLLKIIPDTNTAMLALRRQEIHANGILAKDYRRYKRLTHLDIHRWYDLNYAYLGFNLKRKPFDELVVRQAMAYGMNKEAIVKAVLQDFGRPAYYPSSPVSWAYPAQNDAPIYPYDPEKATDLLRSAGFEKNRAGFYERDGQALSFTLLTNKGNPNRERAAVIIQRFMQEIGIDVKIQLMEWSSFIKILNAKQDPKDFDMVLLGWNIGLDPDSYSVWHSSQYPAGFNFVGYESKAADFLLDKARGFSQMVDRKPEYQSLFTEIAQDVPYIFLYHTETLMGVNTQLRGLGEPGPAGLMNRIERVELVP